MSYKNLCFYVNVLNLCYISNDYCQQISPWHFNDNVEFILTVFLWKNLVIVITLPALCEFHFCTNSGTKKCLYLVGAVCLKSMTLVDFIVYKYLFDMKESSTKVLPTLYRGRSVIDMIFDAAHCKLSHKT
jgi:hypothetical protein